MGSALTYPLDTLRILSQTAPRDAQGIVALWRDMQTRRISPFSGIIPAVGAQTLMYALLFGTYTQIRSILENSFESQDPAARIGKAALAGLMTGVAMSPITSP